MPTLNEHETFYLKLSTCMGILNLRMFVSARQKVIWLGVSGLTLNLMSLACKGYTPASEIKTFDANVKQKVLNHEKRKKNIKV